LILRLLRNKQVLIQTCTKFHQDVSKLSD